MRFFLLLYAFCTLSLRAQNSDEKLAAQFFSDKEYGRAADLYEELASAQPESVYYYDNLLQCYIRLSDFRSAEKLIDKRIRRFARVPAYRVDKAWLYDLQGNAAQRDAVFRDLLKSEVLSAEEAELLANGFIKRRFYEQAAEVYIRARKSLKDPTLFAYGLSELYFAQSKTREGSAELLELAAGNEFLMEDVKSRLVIAYTDPAGYKVLSNLLLFRLQKDPDNLVCNDLLVWSFTQQKDWNGALIQSKAVDKRLNEDGRKVLELASVLVQNEEYEYALRAFEYVKSLGSDRRYYYQSQQGLLNCGLLQVRARNGAAPERLLSMENEYLQFLGSNGINWQTAQQIKELSELYIYYLHQPQKAIAQLQKAIAIPGVNPRLLAECKLALGDAQLITGETWEADLLYKQVEKSYTNDALGQEARFRYARLCYFRGEFEWSQTQLDVLKEATSQLISNNAMRLWLTIQDNTGLDSSEEALRQYAEAELLIFQNRLEEALKVLEELPFLFPGHTLSDEIWFSRAQICELQGRYTEAETYYRKVISDYSFDILADNALIQLARMYEYRMNDTASARKIYEIIVLNYSGSLYISEARRRYRFLRGDMLKDENSF